MNCGKCNLPLAPNADFCGNCGTPVLKNTATVATPAISVPVTPPEPNQQSQQQTTSQPVAPLNIANKKPIFFRRYWWFAAIALLLTPIIGLAIILTGDIYRKSKISKQYEIITKKEKNQLFIMLAGLFVLYALRLSK